MEPSPSLADQGKEATE